MFRSRRLFTVLCVLVIITGIAGVVLITTSNNTVAVGDTIPKSALLSTLPPQTLDNPEFTSTIANLPTALSYTQTRNIQDTIGYIADPTKKGSNFRAEYREGSSYVAEDGRQAFLVDVPSAMKTFVVYDNTIVDCAAPSQQKEPSWHCELPQGEDYE